MAVVQGEFWSDIFLKPNGAPYAGVRVEHYAAGTSTPKTVWTDGAMAVPAAAPVVGDTSGRVSFYGDGDYRLVVKAAVGDGGATLYDWDPIKLTAKAATLRGENQGVSYPAATSANRGQLFAKTDGAGDITNLALQKDTAFSEVFLLGASLGSTVQFGRGADLASASTLVLGSDGNFFNVTGAVTIAGLSSKPAGTTIWLRFRSALNLLPGTSLVLPYGVAYRTIVDEIVAFVSDGAGAWQLVWRSGPTTAPGSISMTGAATADDGHVLCDGNTLLRATYPGAFARVGVAYGVGAGDGLTFSAPSAPGRVPVGAGTGTGGGASGTGKPTGGSALTAIVAGTWKGTENAVNIAHAHGTTDAGHVHQEKGFNDASGEGSVALRTGTQGGTVPSGVITPTVNAESSTTFANDNGTLTTVSATTGVSVDSAGVAGTGLNIQPVFGVTFQMRV